MPVLKHAKYERFAQELAKGKTATEAYVLAGYRANDGNAATLKGNQMVSNRVAELLERSATKAELTIQTATEALLRIAEKGEALQDAPGFNVAKGAWMDACKLAGLIVEKKEVGKPGEFSRMTEDELEEFIASRQGVVSGSLGREAGPGREKGMRKPSNLH